jgi:hypothetical protein
MNMDNDDAMVIVVAICKLVFDKDLHIGTVKRELEQARLRVEQFLQGPQQP